MDNIFSCGKAIDQNISKNDQTTDILWQRKERKLYQERFHVQKWTLDFTN